MYDDLDVASEVLAAAAPEVESRWLDIIINFIQMNWFTLSTSIAGIVLTVFIYILQNKKANSAYLEKIKYAKREIIDTLESYIINKLNISESTILNLKIGTERNYQVVIEQEWSSISILQDISFRLQTSRHLAIDQKLEYSLVLDKMILEIKNNRLINKSTNSSLNDLINKIIKEVPGDKSDIVTEYLFQVIQLQENEKSKEKNKIKPINLEILFRSISMAFIAISIAVVTSKSINYLYPVNKEKALDIEPYFIFNVLVLLSSLILLAGYLLFKILFKDYKNKK